jgi:hypothetical protein
VLAFTPPADHILPVLIAVAVAVPDTVSDPVLMAVPATTFEDCKVPVLRDVVATNDPIVPVAPKIAPLLHTLPAEIVVAPAVPDTVSDPLLIAVPATTFEDCKVPVLRDVVATRLPIVPVAAFIAVPALTAPADHMLPVLTVVAPTVPDTTNAPALIAVPATTFEL